MIESTKKISIIVLVGLSLLFSGLFPNTVFAVIIITNLQVSEITNTSAVVTWNSSVSGDSWVGYRPAAGGDVTEVMDSTPKQNHRIVLSGLLPGTSYVYEANTISGQDEGYIGNQSFMTLGENIGEIYPAGSLVNDGGTVFFISGRDKVKIPFTTWDAFIGLGYKAENIVNGNLSSYRLASSYFISSKDQEHPWGSWVVWKDGTVYYHHSTGMIPVPSWEVFLFNGGQAKFILPMNRADELIWEKAKNLPLLQVGDGRLL